MIYPKSRMTRYITDDPPLYRTEGDMAKAKEAVVRSQARYTGRTFSDSAALIRDVRNQ
jgi:hypothetical protein